MGIHTKRFLREETAKPPILADPARYYKEQDDGLGGSKRPLQVERNTRLVEHVRKERGTVQNSTELECSGMHRIVGCDIFH